VSCNARTKPLQANSLAHLQGSVFGGGPNWLRWVAGDLFNIQKYWRYAWFVSEGISPIACGPVIHGQLGESQELLLYELGQQGQHRTAEASQ